MPSQSTFPLNDPLPLLSLGDRGAAVSALRQLLAKCDRHFGVVGILVSDTFDSQLEAIIRIFQHQVFLTQDGVVGPKTWESLSVNTPVYVPTLQLGTQSTAVHQVQKRLKWHGDYAITCDGDFGEQMLESVIRFQTEQEIVADGVVGPVTWHHLSLI